MSRFTSHQASAETGKPAARTLILPTSAFATDWEQRPKAEVCVGICLVSEDDIQRGKANAVRQAWERYPRDADSAHRYDAFDSFLMQWICARGTCDPNDETKPYELWAEAPEDIIPRALSVEGMKAVFDAIEQLAIESSPTTREIRDEEIVDLVALSMALPSMPAFRARRVRRLLGYCLTELQEFEILLAG